MKIKNLKGFTLLEVLVSLTYITIVSSSIYLMASYLISSTEVISNNYLRSLYVLKNPIFIFFIVGAIFQKIIKEIQ